MRRFLALIMLFVSTLTAAAFDYGDFSYNITSNADRTVELAGTVNKSITTANIPSTVSYGGTQYRVTNIHNDAFKSCYSLTTVSIPNSVTSCGTSVFRSPYRLTQINVATDNPNFSSVGGVLCDKAGQKLLFFPQGRTGDYTTPSGITSIEEYAFYSSDLTSVTLSSSVANIDSEAFIYSSLTRINVASGNPYYSSIDGVVFDKAVKTLIVYPRARKGAYTIPAGVTSIGDYAFENCSSLSSITIPNSVMNIGTRAFDNCSSLTSITIPNSVTSIKSFAFVRCM